MEEILKKNKYKILVICILAIGFLVRLCAIDVLPKGLNQDEASAGYEAFSLLHYGVDRHNNIFPVQFIAWGSGQNVLYSEIMMIFIAIFGLNTFAVRLPMAIIGCISLVVFYLLLKRNMNNKIALIGLFFMAICPWHIMKSRWGLESNLFPDLILYAVFCIIEALKKKKFAWFYIGFGILGISGYAYGTSYFFLPVFVILLLCVLIKKEKITIKQGIIALAIVAVIDLPLIGYVIINTFDLPQINLPFMTIPRLTANRYQEVSSIFSKDFFKESIGNFIDATKLFIGQNEDYPWNLISFFGLTYVFSLPFTITGLLQSFVKEAKNKKINICFNIWFIAAFLLLFVCEPNTNRCNCLVIPLIYYTMFGIYCITENVPSIKCAVISMYLIAFLSFCYTYFYKGLKNDAYFETDIQEMIEYVDNVNVEKIYIDNSFIEPYIYTLFYSKYNTKEFANTVKYSTKGENFEQVKSFGKYNFYIPNNFDENAIYVVQNGKKLDIDYSKYKVTTLKRFTIIEKEY